MKTKHLYNSYTYHIFIRGEKNKKMNDKKKTTISIYTETLELLKQQGYAGDSYDTVIKKLIQQSQK